MTPLIPRLHLFEITDQPWFPAFLRSRIQDALTAAWNSNTPLQPRSPARIAAATLIRELGSSLSSYTFVDFCAGGGGPSPVIQRTINKHLKAEDKPPVDFILTDLHPNVAAWEKVAERFPQIAYERQSVDATNAPQHLVERQDGKKVMRLFNLSFHHFDDALARDILKDTIHTSQGFTIFELQDRSLSGMISVLMLGVGAILFAPFFAWKLQSPVALAFSWLIPVLPFVLVMYLRIFHDEARISAEPPVHRAVQMSVRLFALDRMPPAFGNEQSIPGE
ncbi:hypothetical protein TARUN_2763 [Trichoderma arundinaceum]|uniref:Class I SAM-dependent methyltransferase n=1 Tax=Trichoderma arundinaceum TaxID=490622 RepID=A0A395NU36_TRIAR|nr:hypothetical protein TARUN_2763 [Trichoderma arundinaceum]